MELDPDVPVLSGEHGKIKREASTRRVGSGCRSLGRADRPGAGDPRSLAPGVAPFHPLPCSLPRTNPGNRHQYKRVNGPYKLVMIAGADNKLPYGNLPRLLIAWMCTEAVRTQSRELILGSSLSEFMDKLGMDSGGGEGRIETMAPVARSFSRAF